MDLQGAKFRITEILTELRKLLRDRRMELLWDENLEIPGYCLCFNGYSTTEGFAHTVEYELYSDLSNAISLCHLNELDDEKHSKLVEIIYSDLNFEDYTYSYKWDEVKKLLTSKQERELDEFLLTQATLRKHILEKLKIDYPSTSNSSKQDLLKLTWLGEQKELAELFEQLRKKGWLAPIPPLKKAAYYRTLVAFFDVPDSEKLYNNLQDYHKPSYSSPIPTNGIFSSISSNVVK